MKNYKRNIVFCISLKRNSRGTFKYLKNQKNRRYTEYISSPP